MVNSDKRFLEVSLGDKGTKARGSGFLINCFKNIFVVFNESRKRCSSLKFRMAHFRFYKYILFIIDIKLNFLKNSNI